MRSRRRAIACIAVVTLLLAGCVSSKKTKTNPTKNQAAKNVSLTLSSNSVSGGKNAAGADWITKVVIPGFVAMEKAKGVTASVKFNGSGVDDEAYKTKLELNLKGGGAADVFSTDGIWLGELASAGYVKPLDDVVGAGAASWDGWSQISKTVQQNLSYQGKLYGIPDGTDGRVIYFNKKLFAQAGLPANWQPTSWDEIISAAQALKKLPGVGPIQINAGVPMGEATTAQGFLPLLAGTGKPLFDESTKKWQGATSQVTAVLDFYKRIYGAGLGDPKLQQDKAGRDATVGYALIPAEKPGMGVNGQDFVSVSGGGGWALNPATRYPQQAWELMAYMESQAAQAELSKVEIRVSARDDVNKATLSGDPLLTFIASKVLPITVYRPSDENYDSVSLALQQATADVVGGKSAQAAAKTYQASLEKAVGGATNVETG